MLRPLGHRLLIRPDPQPDVSPGGLILPQDRDHVPVSGTVVAVGAGSSREARIRRATLTRCLHALEATGAAAQSPAVDALLAEWRRALTEPDAGVEPAVRVGDRVAFPADVGLSLTEDGEAYLIVNEDEVIVLEEQDTGDREQGTGDREQGTSPLSPVTCPLSPVME